MTSYRLTPAAQRDLSSIWDFTAERWDARQAETDIGEIRSAIERVAADPRRARSRDDVRTGYWSYAVISHVVFFRIGGEAIEVIRILHQRMDPSRHD